MYNEGQRTSTNDMSGLSDWVHSSMSPPTWILARAKRLQIQIVKLIAYLRKLCLCVSCCVLKIVPIA